MKRKHFHALRAPHLKSGSWCRNRWSGLMLTVGCLPLLMGIAAPELLAQRTPHLGYVYPAGGRQGSSFEVVVGGQHLAGASMAYVSGAGVQAEIDNYDRPIPQKRVNEIREKLKEIRTQMNRARKEGKIGAPGEAMKQFTELAEEQGITVAELKKAAAYRRQQQDPKRQLNPQIAETVTLKVKVAPDAVPGPRELRLGLRTGLSNPVTFCVGPLPELCETVYKPELNWEYLIGAGRGNAPNDDPVEAITHVGLPVIVNGQILPGEVDQFRFAARKGQQLVAAVSARSLIPYLADAVPGWFQATVALYDAKGNEVAYADDYRFDPDPVLFYEIPRNGSYTLKIKDAIYRGREDFVYRIALGELPFITGIFPLGGPAGQTTSVELTGWNLPVNKLNLQPSATETGITRVSVKQGDWVSNLAPFAVGTLPELSEQEPNNIAANAQSIALPLIINGGIDEAGDTDVFRFNGHAGDVVVAEVFARRLNSPLDSMLELRDSAGRELAANDDHPDPAAGLNTHHADSRIQATLPGNGAYYLHLKDAQAKWGNAYAYRLQVTPPRPDFQLLVVPSSLGVRAGTSRSVTVHVLREEGFTNDIELSLKDAPRGFSLGNTRLSGETNQFQVKVKVAQTAPKSCNLVMVGRALVAGAEIIHSAVPAEEVMQAFIYRHLVPAQEMKVAVIGPAHPTQPVSKSEERKSPLEP